MNKKPTILITGGAGYIGAHTAHLMMKQGYNVVVLDTFRHNQKLPESFFKKILVIKKDFADKETLKTIFQTYNVHAVMHFAALIEVGESVKNPLAFYNNNVVKTIQLLETMLEYNVSNFIFSSSCAVYGTPKKIPIPEDHPKQPISPYGKNKLIVEMALEDFSRSYGLNFVSLRYFNAAGASPQYKLGEQHTPETHLIPLLLRAAENKKPFYVFGNDYPTPDGTCVRDFLHVQDLANAHARAFEYLQKGGTSEFFNLGTGKGFSVNEVIKAVETICKTKIKTVVTEKREGDPPQLVADPSKAQKILNWCPQHSSLEKIIQSAYNFYCDAPFSLNSKKKTSPPFVVRVLHNPKKLSLVLRSFNEGGSEDG